MKKLLIILLLISNPCFGIKKLNPGDVVKGKTINETYYAYSEAEQAEVMLRLRNASRTMLLLKNREQKIELLKQEIGVLKSYSNKYTDIIASYTILTNKAFDREKNYSEIAKKLVIKVKRERSARKKSFLLGIMTPLITAYFLRK